MLPATGSEFSPTVMASWTSFRDFCQRINRTLSFAATNDACSPIGQQVSYLQKCLSATLHYQHILVYSGFSQYPAAFTQCFHVPPDSLQLYAHISRRQPSEFPHPEVFLMTEGSSCLRLGANAHSSGTMVTRLEALADYLCSRRIDDEVINGIVGAATDTINSWTQESIALSLLLSPPGYPAASFPILPDLSAPSALYVWLEPPWGVPDPWPSPVGYVSIHHWLIPHTPMKCTVSTIKTFHSKGANRKSTGLGANSNHLFDTQLQYNIEEELPVIHMAFSSSEEPAPLRDPCLPKSFLQDLYSLDQLIVSQEIDGHSDEFLVQTTDPSLVGKIRLLGSQEFYLDSYHREVSSDSAGARVAAAFLPTPPPLIDLSNNSTISEISHGPVTPHPPCVVTITGPAEEDFSEEPSPAIKNFTQDSSNYTGSSVHLPIGAEMARRRSSGMFEKSHQLPSAAELQEVIDFLSGVRQFQRRKSSLGSLASSSGSSRRSSRESRGSFAAVSPMIEEEAENHFFGGPMDMCSQNSSLFLPSGFSQLQYSSNTGCKSPTYSGKIGSLCAGLLNPQTLPNQMFSLKSKPDDRFGECAPQLNYSRSREHLSVGDINSSVSCRNFMPRLSPSSDNLTDELIAWSPGQLHSHNSCGSLFTVGADSTRPTRDSLRLIKSEGDDNPDPRYSSFL